MANGALANERGDARVARAADAHWLANLLRLSPLTLLHGEAGAGKTTLLRHDLMPLLRRRSSDGRPAGAVSGRVVPFPDRRLAGGRIGGQPEVAVLFDAWDSHPLDGLRRQVGEALGSPPTAAQAALPLAQYLADAARTHGVFLLLVLDAFDTLLSAPDDDEGAAAFTEALIDTLQTPELPVNVFLVARNDTAPGLLRLRDRVPGFGDRWLRVRHWLTVIDNAPAPLSLVAPPAAALQTPVSITAPAAVSALIVQAVDPTAAAPALTPSPPPSPAPSPPPPPAPAATPRNRQPSGRGAAIAAALGLALACTAGLVWRGLSDAGPSTATVPSRPSAPAARVPSPAVPPAPAAPPVAPTGPVPFTVVADTGTDRPDVLLTELAGALVPTGATAPAIVLSAGPDDAPFALMRHDVLQQRRTDSPEAALRVVAPLFTDALTVVVRADSPMRTLADLAGQRINVGPPGRPRAATAASAYARVVGGPMAADRTDAAPLDAALAALIGPRTVDAVALAVPQPAAWLAQQTPDVRRAVRLLPWRTADIPVGAADRARQLYLPTPLDLPGAAGAETLASMVFLVARPGASDRLIADTVQALCTRLPTLRRDGDPRWRGVMPARALPTAWPTAPAATAALQRCAE